MVEIRNMIRLEISRREDEIKFFQKKLIYAIGKKHKQEKH